MKQTYEAVKQDTQGPQKQAETQAPIFELQRVYVKSISLQLADPTETFLLKWEPAIGFEIKVNNRELKTPNTYEIVLDGTLNLKIADKDIGTLKVEQAGIFRVEGFDEQQKKMILSGHCQDFLYPYFCSQVAHITTDAGFPALLMRPMSFTSLYQQSLQKEQGIKSNDSSTKFH